MPRITAKPIGKVVEDIDDEEEIDEVYGNLFGEDADEVDSDEDDWDDYGAGQNRNTYSCILLDRLLPLYNTKEIKSTKKQAPN